MGSFLPWWLLIAPAILLVVDAAMSPKTSSHSTATRDVPAATARRP